MSSFTSSVRKSALSTISKRCGLRIVRWSRWWSDLYTVAMKLLIAAVGKLKDGSEDELVARYADRTALIGRALALGPVDIREIAESRAKRPDDRKREEAEALSALLVPSAPLAAL